MLPSNWGPILRNPRSRKVIIVSVIFGREFPAIDDHLHIGLIPGALRMSTHPGVEIVDSGSSYPYWPQLVEWPEIDTGFSPIERRAEIASATIRIMAESGISFDLIGAGGLPSGYGRIDLWSDGIGFRQVIPLLQGPITETSYSRDRGTIEISIADGDLKRKVEFPPGSFRIERDEFPQAPDIVAGYTPRTTIFGPFPDQVPCYQIDREGREFYVCEPALSIGPGQVYIGGENIEDREDIKFPEHSVGVMSNNQTYSKLTFDRPIHDSSLVGQVTCSGGVGIWGEHPAIALLRYGGYRLSDQALQLLRSLPLNFFVFVNNSGDVRELVTERLLKQTDLVGTLRHDRYHVYQLGGFINEITMAPGSGLIFRDLGRDVETSADDVANAIEVRFQRDLFTTGDTTRTAYLLDKENGDATMRPLLRLSERLYGRRYLRVDAPDLVQYLDSAVAGVPRNVINLAIIEAKQKALIHKEYTYLADWYHGLAADLNWRVLLTDPDLGLTAAPTRLIRRVITSTGPRVTLQTELVP